MISLFFSSLITRYIYIYISFSLSLYESSSNHRCYCGAGSHRAPSTSNSWHDAQHATSPSPPFDMSTTPLSTFLLVVPPWSIRFSLLLLLARGWRRVSRSRQPRKTYLFEVDGRTDAGETGYPHASNAIVLPLGDRPRTGRCTQRG